MRTIVIDEKKNLKISNGSERVFFEDEFNALETRSCFYDFAAKNRAKFYLDNSETEKSLFVKKIEEMFNCESEF